MEIEASKTSIVLYNKTSKAKAEKMSQELKRLCKCTVRHLPGFPAFILKYRSAKHIKAKELMKVKGVKLAFEDHVLEFYQGDQVYHNRSITAGHRPNSRVFQVRHRKRNY